MRATFGHWGSKVLALALLCGLIASVWSFTVVPLVQRFEAAQDSIAQERLLLGRLLEQARRAQTSSATGTAGQDALVFLAGDSDAERIAGLQAHVEDAAARAGVEVTSSQVTPGQVRAPLRMVGVQAQVSGGIAALQALLHTLETGTPTLVVDQMDISRSPPAEGQPEGDLTMRLTVVGATPAGGS